MYVTTLLIIALSITVCNCGTLYGMDGTGNFSIYDPITGNKTLVKQFQNLAIQEVIIQQIICNMDINKYV